MEIDINNLPIHYIKRLNQIVISESQSYNLFFDKEIITKSKDSIPFYLSGISTRDINLNPMYETICILELLKEDILQKKYEIIIVQNFSQKLIFQSFIQKNKLDIKIYLDRKAQLKEFFSIIYNWLGSIYLLFQEYFWNKVYSSKSVIKDKIILLDTFLLNTSFDSNGKFVDNYYKNYGKYLDKKENIFFFFTLIIYKDYPSYLKKLQESGVKYVLRAHYLKFIDFFLACFFPLRVLQLISFNETSYKGINISNLVNYSLIKTCTSNSVISANLHYKFFQRLKEQDIELEFVIDWFENQLIDRALYIGIRKYYPECQINGYLGSIPPDSYIHLFPSEKESELKLVPDSMFVTGSGIVKRYQRANKNINIRSGPAFRYSPVDYNQKKTAAVYNILVALPFELDHSAQILNLLKNNPFSKLGSDIFLKIKPHPTYTPNDMKLKFPDIINDNFEFTNLSMTESFKVTNLLISANSSVCLEAIASGIPVIVICSMKNITHVRIPSDIGSNIWGLAYGLDDLLSLVSKFFFNREMNFIPTANEVRDKYFNAVTKENVNELFGIN